MFFLCLLILNADINERIKKSDLIFVGKGMPSGGFLIILCIHVYHVIMKTYTHSAVIRLPYCYAEVLGSDPMVRNDFLKFFLLDRRQTYHLMVGD